MKALSPPQSIDELLQRARDLAGLKLADIVQSAGIASPSSLNHGKGWTGQLCELLLGSDAGCESAPDFIGLGVELKTLPMDPSGKVLESTFVSTIPLLTISQQQWQTSNVYQKLQTVLWLPIICPDKHALLDRSIGMPLLWQPDAAQTKQLQADWCELTDMIALGQLEAITAKQGQYLQVRPKGANAKALAWGIDAEGNKMQTLPRGFYLRAGFTQAIVDAGFHRASTR